MLARFRPAIALAAFCAALGAAQAAPGEAATESRPVDAGITRVKLDGVIDIRIRQGSVAALVLSGEPRLLAATTARQSGDTLRLSTEGRHVRPHGERGLRAELTLPELREVASESLGSTAISGFSGAKLDLSLEGAGSMTVTCDYARLTASLGGLGSMNIAGLNSEGVELDLQGAGRITLAGRSKWLKADLGGLGGLDAQQFQTDTVTLDMSGLGSATVNARQNATLTLSGMGSVTVYGKPLNRRVSIDGLGKVSWK